jgi:hypothetical protein
MAFQFLAYLFAVCCKEFVSIVEVSVLEGLLARIIAVNRPTYLHCLQTFVDPDTDNNPSFQGVIGCITFNCVHLTYKKEENLDAAHTFLQGVRRHCGHPIL